LIAPELSCGYQLVVSWAYLYDDVRTDGIGVHADIARVNINCWITPDEANLDPSETSGGIVVVPARPPRDWHETFLKYNAPDASDPAFWAGLNAQSGGRNITVGYKQNRCVIFDSELYHWCGPADSSLGYLGSVHRYHPVHVSMYGPPAPAHSVWWWCRPGFHHKYIYYCYHVGQGHTERTDRVNFKRGYDNRRINLTFLYGGAR